MPLHPVEVLGDGHCFYHSLLYALRDAGLLDLEPEVVCLREGVSKLAYRPDDVNAVKGILLRSLRECLENEAELGEMARSVFEEALQGEDHCSAPLVERLLLDSEASCGLRHFATDAEVMLAAFAFEVSLCIHDEGRRIAYLPDLTACDGAPPPTPATPTLHLRMHMGHFDPLVRRSTREAPQRSASWPPLAERSWRRVMQCGADLCTQSGKIWEGL